VGKAAALGKGLTRGPIRNRVNHEARGVCRDNL